VTHAKNTPKYRAAPILSRSRRSFFSKLLLAAAVPAIFPVAATVAAEPARSRIHDLIALLNASTEAMEAAGDGTTELEIAAGDRGRAIEELLGEQPATIEELDAKVKALMPIFAEDDEDQTLPFILARDIDVLARASK
jgi:hypothetical protein